MPHPDNQRWYQCSAAQALERLRTSPEGLPAEEARNRLPESGPNELRIRKP